MNEYFVTLHLDTKYLEEEMDVYEVKEQLIKDLTSQGYNIYNLFEITPVIHNEQRIFNNCRKPFKQHLTAIKSRFKRLSRLSKR